MPGSIVLIREKTSDLKRRFRERTAERRRKNGAARDEAELERRSIFRNSSSEESSVASKSSNMMSFAIASSTIASSCNSGTDSSKSSHHRSNLYRSSSKQENTRVVHPVIYKRDIYLASRKHHKSTNPAVQQVVKDRRVMSDVSNGPDSEAKTSLPAFSLTGSMLCRELEKGSIRENGTRANQSTASPQKPMVLPPTTIMASMLFRTLEQEEKSESTGRTRNQYGVPIRARTTIPDEVVPSPANTVKSGVSELTMHTIQSKEDPRMAKASKNLLCILQSNQFQEFDAEAKTTLYEA